MLFFNIHNIFKFSLKGKISPELEKFFNKELKHFKTKELTVDLEIEVVSEIPDPEIVFYPKYGKSGNCFYIRDPRSNKVGILSDSKVIAESKVSGYFLLDEIIEPLMFLHALRRGYSFLHASAVARNGKGMIFSSAPKTGKTNIAISLLQSESSFLANELVLISKKGIVYPYPRPILVYPYNIRAIPELLDRIPNNNFIQKQKIKFLFPFCKIKNIYSLKYPKSLLARGIQLILREIVGQSFSLEPRDVGAEIGKPFQIDKVFLLFINNALDEPEIETVRDKKLFTTQLWVNMLREKNNFFMNLSLMYKFCFPEKRATIKNENLKLGEKIIYNALKKAKCFRLMIPGGKPFKEVFKKCQKYFY